MMPVAPEPLGTTGASRGIPGDADCVLKILGWTKNDAEGGFFSTQKVSIHAESNAMRNSVHVIVRRYNCYNGASMHSV